MNENRREYFYRLTRTNLFILKNSGIPILLEKRDTKARCSVTFEGSYESLYVTWFDDYYTVGRVKLSEDADLFDIVLSEEESIKLTAGYQKVINLQEIQHDPDARFRFKFSSNEVFRKYLKETTKNIEAFNEWEIRTRFDAGFVIKEEWEQKWKTMVEIPNHKMLVEFLSNPENVDEDSRKWSIPVGGLK